MKRTHWLSYAYLRFCSKPLVERVIFRAIARQKARRFVEIGMGEVRRGPRMLAVANRFHPIEALCYTGIDLFDARTEYQAPLSLKSAHRTLRPLAGKVHLVPGEPYAALSHCANRLVHSDVILINSSLDDERMKPAWFYYPRMLHRNTQVFLVDGEGEDIQLTPMDHETIQQRASSSPTLLRTAA